MTKHTNHTDLHKDIADIKAALAQASYDLKGKAGEILCDSMEDIKEHSSEMKENIANYTAEKPFKTIGIAVLAGVVLGFLLKR